MWSQVELPDSDVFVSSVHVLASVLGATGLSWMVGLTVLTLEQDKQALVQSRETPVNL